MNVAHCLGNNLGIQGLALPECINLMQARPLHCSRPQFLHQQIPQETGLNAIYGRTPQRFQLICECITGVSPVVSNFLKGLIS